MKKIKLLTTMSLSLLGVGTVAAIPLITTSCNSLASDGSINSRTDLINYLKSHAQNTLSSRTISTQEDFISYFEDSVNFQTLLNALIVTRCESYFESSSIYSQKLQISNVTSNSANLILSYSYDEDDVNNYQLNITCQYFQSEGRFRLITQTDDPSYGPNELTTDYYAYKPTSYKSDANRALYICSAYGNHLSNSPVKIQFVGRDLNIDNSQSTVITDTITLSGYDWTNVNSTMPQITYYITPQYSSSYSNTINWTATIRLYNSYDTIVEQLTGTKNLIQNVYYFDVTFDSGLSYTYPVNWTYYS